MADALAIVAAFLFALAAVLQQKGAVKDGAGGMSVGFFLNLLRSPPWLLGSTALLCGYAVQGAALDRGRLVIIQPLLVSTIVFALPLGVVLTHQVVTRRDWAAAAGVVAALATFIVVGDPAAGVDDAPDWQWAVSSAVVIALAAVVLLAGRRARPPRRAAALGTAAGLLFGMSASLAKPVVEELDEGLSVALGDWRAWALVGMGVAAFLIQQGALATGQLAPAVATTSLANPVVASILGIVILEERLAGGIGRKSVAIGALVVAALCAIALAEHEQERGAQGDPGPQADAEPERDREGEPDPV
ncbi:MAG TPA: DMT family transporter [Miltoncostaeaceae bacterium]|nr:DMT family transporter [Miltoncostaeaceae bacterium]